MFPVLFFLTAVPWPPRLEQPLTSDLMIVVASATTEILHWLGVAAQTSGGAIALRSGLVGITEACSGIRSLQAGTMFGLAMGEWFLLRPSRRLILLGIAVLLALVTNLARTLTLALQAEWHGANSVDQVHDSVGNIVITTLVVAIWLAGRLLSHSSADETHVLLGFGGRAKRLLSNLFVPRRGILALATIAIVLGIISARLLYAHNEGSGYTQTGPHFSSQTGPSTMNELAPVPREVWNELRPTSGEYIRHRAADGTQSDGDCFHFFWKPSVWNRFALVHRPDICMPGIGWQSAAPPESVDVDLNGRSVRFYLFRFRRGSAHALELWGAWRNGDPVPLNYTVRQVFGVEAPPTTLPLQGKRRSATEIVGCSVIGDSAEPRKEIAVALLQSVFIYNRP
jgi:exosortase/archaeosortase family protein